MFFLIQAIKKGHTVVYESVQLRTSWVFSKSGSRIINKRLEIQDALELRSEQTIHLFDAKAGADSYEITRVIDGAKQVVFSSTNMNSYTQFLRSHGIFQVILPSTSQEEFEKYVALFGVSKDVEDEVVEISGYGKIRPLRGVEAHKSRLEEALNNFDINQLATYASTRNTVSNNKNPAILLDAKCSEDVFLDEQDATIIFNAYKPPSIRWYFCSDYIVERIFRKYGNDADIMVEKMYFALGSDFYRTFGPAIGSLFEKCAVKAAFIPRHGLVCKSVKKIKGNKNDKKNEENDVMTLGIGCEVQDYHSDNLIPISDVLKNCTNPKIIYNFAKNNEGFDCFIPPNNFIGFTQRLQDTKTPGNHPISLSFALECCKLIEKGPVNFITAVPAHQADTWGDQSFNVNVQDVVNQINKENNSTMNFGGQRKFDKLPFKTQTQLKKFHQFVGSLTVKRKFCTAVRLNAPTLIRSSMFSIFKYLK